MAQGTINRLTYERLGILLTDSPAYKLEGSKYSDLIRVQSMDYSFSHQDVDVKAIGSDELITRDGQSPIIRAPDVNCSINYLFCEGQNEIAAGFYIGSDSSVLKNIVGSADTDDINIIIVASNKDEHEDLSFLDSEADFEGYNIIGIGNAFLSNYQYSASVGSLPESSITYLASNMKYDLYSTSDKPTLPAVKLGLENSGSLEQLYLDTSMMKDLGHDREDKGYVFDQHFNPEVSVIRPGDIKITMTKQSGARGGAILNSIDAAVQNVSISLPISRQDIYGMGSNYIFNRKLKMPIIGQMSIDMIVRGYNQDEVDSFLTKADVYDVKIQHPISDRILGDQGSTLVEGLYYYVAVEKNEWKQVFMTSVTRDVSGSSGDVDFSEDGNFYYICIDQFNWGQINLSDSDRSFDGEIAYDYNFVYVKNEDVWKKFNVNNIDYKNLPEDTALTVSSDITFRIHRAQLKQQSYSHSIGQNVEVSSSMTFDVTKVDGLSLYFN